MRNRGIEIYMINDDKPITEDLLDLKSLISLKGLKVPQLLEFLIKVHQAISNLILGEKPTINEILQSSFLISQQLNYGVVDYVDVILEVYYKSRSSVEFDSSDPVAEITSLVKSILKDVNSIHSEGELNSIFNENITLRTEELQIISDIAKVKQQSAVLQSLIPFRSTDRIENIFRCALANAYGIASTEDLEIRHLYLKNILSRKDDQTLISNFKLLLANAFGSTKLPLDPRWVPDISFKEKIIEKGNNLNLSLQTAIQYHAEKLRQSEYKAEMKKSKKLSLYDYMIERQKGHVQDKFENVVVNEFIELLKEFDDHLGNLFLRATLTDEDVIEIMYLLTWRFLFFDCSLKNIKNVSATDTYNILTNLTVHYTWFFKHSLQKISTITNVNLTENLDGIVQKINRKLSKHFTVLNKISKGFRKHNSRPPPLINEHQVEVIPDYNNIVDKYNICDRRNDAIKILSILDKDSELKIALIDLKEKLNFDFTDLSKDITLVKSLHEKYEEFSPEELSKFALEILPLKDYFYQLEMKNSLCNIQENSTTKQPINLTVLSVEIKGLLNRFVLSKDQRLIPEIKRLCQMYLMSSAFIKPVKYLRTEQDEMKEVNLANFTPLLTFYMNYLLVNASRNTISNLGNFRELLKQHNLLKGLLWNNVSQLSSNSYNYM